MDEALTFGVSFSVEAGMSKCMARIVFSGAVFETEPCSYRDTLRIVGGILDGHAHTWLERSLCLSSLHRSGYGLMGGINVRIVILGGAYPGVARP